MAVLPKKTFFKSRQENSGGSLASPRRTSRSHRSDAALR